MVSRLNNLNSFLQSQQIKIYTLRNKTDAFKMELVFWNVYEQKGDIDIFSCLQDLVEVLPLTKKCYYLQLVSTKKQLSANFGQYFPENPDPRKEKFWIVKAGFHQA